MGVSGMEIIEKKTFDKERALYGLRHAYVRDCSFTGPADGESVLKECEDIVAERCFCNLRYPFWHVHGLKIHDCDITEHGRAALWYSDHIEISESRLHGIKALRECHEVAVTKCDIVSNECGWFSRNFRMADCTVRSDYFMLHAKNLNFSNIRFSGKYALQYIHDCTFENCDITSRDAFWHARNVTVRNCELKGEFLGWYSDHLTLEHCRIISSQPLCYCDNLKLVECEVVDSDLCFEKSDVDAVITTSVDSIKNPRSGRIVVPAVEELIQDSDSHAEVVVTGTSVA